MDGLEPRLTPSEFNLTPASTATRLLVSTARGNPRGLAWLCLKSRQEGVSVPQRCTKSTVNTDYEFAPFVLLCGVADF
jgi:hypothetical protein